MMQIEVIEITVLLSPMCKDFSCWNQLVEHAGHARLAVPRPPQVPRAPNTAHEMVRFFLVPS
ncbi:hypothetical protein FHT78_005130 [Rhizobium sp. BK196]|jgi:hypothetical protein|nr:hypothetical protein [Rhizobium sp. BK196]MBB3464457.1 hypothetical protein [Rhizobium sp. BK377]